MAYTYKSQSVGNGLGSISERVTAFCLSASRDSGRCGLVHQKGTLGRLGVGTWPGWLSAQGGRWIVLPQPRLVSKSRSRWRATFCAWSRQAPTAKFGRVEHLAQFQAQKSDTQDRCFSVGSHDACMARGSQINDTQALQPIRFQRAPGPHLLGGARPCVGPGMCTCACERGRPRLSGCAIGGAVPEVTDQLRISASQ